MSKTLPDNLSSENNQDDSYNSNDFLSGDRCAYINIEEYEEITGVKVS